jgi:hypothetical protein
VKNEFDVEEMIKRIDREVKKYEGKLSPKDRKKYSVFYHNKDTVELWRVCRLSTLKNTLLWFLEEKELEF